MIALIDRFVEWGLLVAAIVIAIIDIFLYLHGGIEETISSAIGRLSRKYAAIPLAFGLLMGHLFL